MPIKQKNVNVFDLDNFKLMKQIEFDYQIYSV